MLMTDNEKVQKLTLYTLNTFIEYCEKYNLKYYFTGGALIGVMRHKGFVPWDDDIDIGMPRKDFDRFHNLIKTDMPVGFGVCNRYTDSNWHFAMSQFIDLESEIQIHLAEQPRNAHIWIDIFPLDGLPNGEIQRWFRVKNILLHRYIVQAANISTQVDSHRERPWHERVILSICKLLHVDKVINTNKVLNHMEKVLRKSDFDESIWCGNMLGRYREREVVKREWFGEPVDGIFAGQVVNIPENSHEILTVLYGDYMKLPPVEKRETHHVSLVKCRDI